MMLPSGGNDRSKTRTGIFLADELLVQVQHLFPKLTHPRRPSQTRGMEAAPLHWVISDRIWQRWKGVKKPSALESTAAAECEELSALYAFLAERAGVKSVGLQFRWCA
jgi:hypothetical protein